MKDEKHPSSSAANFNEFLSLILKRKTLICLITLSAALAAVVASFFITPVYRAETKILPPQMRSMNLFPQSLVGNGYSLDLMKTATAVNAAGYSHLWLDLFPVGVGRDLESPNLAPIYRPPHVDRSHQRGEGLLVSLE